MRMSMVLHAGVACTCAWGAHHRRLPRERFMGWSPGTASPARLQPSTALPFSSLTVEAPAVLRGNPRCPKQHQPARRLLGCWPECRR